MPSLPSSPDQPPRLSCCCYVEGHGWKSPTTSRSRLCHHCITVAAEKTSPLLPEAGEEDTDWNRGEKPLLCFDDLHHSPPEITENRGEKVRSQLILTESPVPPPTTAKLAGPATTPKLLLLRRMSRLEEPNHLKVTALPPLHCRRRRENFTVAARGRGGGHGLVTEKLVPSSSAVRGREGEEKGVTLPPLSRGEEITGHDPVAAAESSPFLLATHAGNWGEKPLLCFDDRYHLPPEITEKRGEKARSQLILTESPVPPPTTAKVSCRRSSMATAWSPPACCGRSLLLELH
nr:hypothetical protein Iba_chr01cCG3650 [Ipomoea batatas]